jgi:hypothetical protein
MSRRSCRRPAPRNRNTFSTELLALLNTPHVSILKAPHCSEGFHLSSLKQLREFLGIGLAGRGLVQANGSSNEGRESLLIDLIVLVEVDCAPGVAFEA